MIIPLVVVEGRATNQSPARVLLALSTELGSPVFGLSIAACAGNNE